MNQSEVERFLKDKSVLANYSPILQSLWYDGNGDWKKAHDLVDSRGGKDAARVHAYLHRKEGDEWNANYWYQRAGEEMPALTLEEEWILLLNRYIQK